jgi:hypothetical protein
MQILLKIYFNVGVSTNVALALLGGLARDYGPKKQLS